MWITYTLLFITLLAIENVYFYIASILNITDKPNIHSSHQRITLLGGGIVFYIGILLYSLFFGMEYKWFLLALTLITIISFLDDIHNLPSKTRLLFHLVASILLFYQIDVFALPWWVIVAALFVCVGTINAYNFMDGINGLTGGYSLVVLCALAFINKYTTEFIDPNIIYVTILSVLVFTFYNFRKKARCFAGDVGAISMAFIIIFLLGKLMITTGNLNYIILLLVYGVDSSITIIHRIILKENIFQPHRKHTYQIMANNLGLGHLAVSTIYITVQLGITTGYLMLTNTTYQWIYLILSFIVLCSSNILFRRNYFKKGIE